MSRLLHFRNLGYPVSLRIDAPALRELGLDLHVAARIGEEECTDRAAADLVWQQASGGGWQILLQGQLWAGAELTADDIYLQSDGLLDDLVREKCAGQTLLHAGGVVDSQGRALALCGPSGAGKTSLVLACLLEGWGWLSDEWLCFRREDACLAEGFRRNFNLKERSFGRFPETSGLAGNREFTVAGDRRRVRFLNPDRLNRGRFHEQGRLRAIVLPLYNSTVEGVKPVPMNGIELADRLARELRSGHLQAVKWLARVCREIPAFSLNYSNPRAVPTVLADLLNRL